MHDCGFLEILRDFFLTPHLLEERRRMIHELGVAVFVDLSRDRVRAGRFSAGELLHDPERGREAEVGVGLHLKQMGDGGLGDGGGTAGNASETFGPSLYNLCLLSELGTVVGAEKRCSTFSWRTVDSFDRGEEVFLFVAVRVPLNLLSLTSRPGVLHLAKSLLHKTATMMEISSVVVGGAVDVGFVQAVLLGEQVVDSGVVVVKPVLVLAACATEFGQRRRLDCIPQLTSSIFHRGVLVSGGSDWNVV
ncbi:hypothetical protein SprV_0100181400 [Sparganum proliferum]